MSTSALDIVAMRIVTCSPLECHQTKKQRLFGGLAMTIGRHNKKRRIARTTSQSLTWNCLRMRFATARTQ
jgi:hypothetical protein